ncbi:MAG TPA: response regulator transcription factor [Gammaproteobacteria bacterium]|jgi:DNA-binding NarL/FixJ family response regulator|nr:response regulator transcription factor [Gammaproteobacteria bacterium]
MIRTCLIEDQTLVREGLKRLLALSEDVELVAVASDADEGVAMTLAHVPEVLLLDLKLPGRSGIEVLKELRDRNALPPTLILTTFDEDSLLIEAMRAGAKGYLLKDVTLEQLVNGIRTLAAGGTLLLPAITDRLLRSIGKELPPSHTVTPENPLTKREVEILRLLASGYNNREIGEAFSVTEGTVKNHVSNILAKLEVRDRTRAVLKALEWGYL